MAKVAKVAKVTMARVSMGPREDGKQKVDGRRRAARERKGKKKDIKAHAGVEGNSVTSRPSARASTRAVCQYKEQKCQRQSNMQAAQLDQQDSAWQASELAAYGRWAAWR